MFCHIFNTIIDDFRPFIIKVKITIDISLSWRCALKRRKSFICASIATTASFFSLITEMIHRSLQTPLHLSDSYKSAVESEYKSSLYKLWQYWIKNKPSLYNDSVITFQNKKYSQTQRAFVANPYDSKKGKQPENYKKQSFSINQTKCLLFQYNFFFRISNNHTFEKPNILGFIRQISAIYHMVLYVQKLLKRNKVYNYKKYSSQIKTVASRIYSYAVYQLPKRQHRIGNINQFFYHKVYCQ